MRYPWTRKSVFIIFAIIAIGVLVGIFVFKGEKKVIEEPKPQVETIQKTERKTIGRSVENRKIEAYEFGNGGTHLLFVGGIHGGYEWNSVTLAFSLIDYLQDNPNAIPQGIKVTIIPSLNPDGVFKVLGTDGKIFPKNVPDRIASASGRFNAHDVDLNRNFDCKWKPKSMWKDNVVSAGSKPFSEPETVALRDFVLENKPVSVIFWHSQANAVYASECENGILPQTRKIMNIYSKASEYSAVDTFDSYEITGDAEGWLASIDIPAITVELQDYKNIEWERNLAGITALFEYYK